MANVTIRCFKNAVEAAHAAASARGKGKRVSAAGPTDVVKIRGEAPDLIVWDSGADAQWHVVIETMDNLECLDPISAPT